MYMTDKNFDTIIIGAGLSGLFCGAILSKKGQKVCIIEKNPEIGGAVQPFSRKGLTFETGMHFFGSINEGQIQNEIFKIIGIDKKVELIEKKEIIFKVVINEKEYEIPKGFNNFKNKLEEYFPNEKSAIGYYIEKIESIFNNLTIKNLFEGLGNSEDMETGAFEFIKSITDDIDLQNLLAFNNLLYGGDKDTTSLYLYAVITGSYISSTPEFVTGTKSFLDLLKSEITNRSGLIHTSVKVEQLETENDHIVSCICSDGAVYTANNFISSLHPSLSLALTKTPLLKSFYRKRIHSLNNSAGAFLVYIIMKDSTFKYNDSVLFFSKSDRVWNSETKGKHSFMMYTPYSGKTGQYAKLIKIMRYMDFKEVENRNETISKPGNEGYKQFKRRNAEDILETLNRIYPDFKDKIEMYYTSTPLTYINYTGTPEGSAYGLVHDYRKFSESNIPIRTKIKNLFLTGQSINFHGMLGVSITSLLTCSSVTDTKIQE